MSCAPEDMVSPNFLCFSLPTLYFTDYSTRRLFIFGVKLKGIYRFPSALAAKLGPCCTSIDLSAHVVRLLIKVHMDVITNGVSNLST